MTIGWQNLTSERQRVRRHDQILFEICKIHPEAFETQVGEDSAYWIGTPDDPEFIGIGWKAEDDGSAWWYAVMNQIAVDLGVQCTLLVVDGKNQIFPGSREVAEQQLIARNNYAEQQLIARNNYDPVPTLGKLLKEEVYQERGKWYKWIETTTIVRELGGFDTRAEAVKASLHDNP